MIWECCKNCICNNCKNNETINGELPEYYCENCDLCDLGDYSREQCKGFIDFNDVESIIKSNFIMQNEIKNTDGPYRIDIIKMLKNHNFKNL